jgi:nucleoside-diphosphate-sugar epimerase
MSECISPTRVLVTGASGFVGAAVVRQLVAEGRQVAVLLRESSDPWRFASIMTKITVVRGDLRYLDAVTDALVAFAPQAVAHLAWEGVKGADRNYPIQLANVQATFSIYQLAKRIGASYFVGLGSQAEYGPCSGRIHESTATRPTTVYGATKLCTGLALDRLAAAEGFAFGWLRLFSTYGRTDDPSWLIPYVTIQLLRGKCPALTAAEQIWDYLHIEDVATAVIAAMDKQVRGIYNLGSGRAVPLNQIISTVRDQIDRGLPLGFGQIPYRTDQVMHLEADISALNAATGWLPNISLADGIADTVNWFRKGSLNVN